MKSQKTDARSIADIYNGLLNESHMQEAPPVIAVEVEPEPEGGCQAAAAGCECAGCEECEPTHERDDSEMHMAKADLHKVSEYATKLSGLLDSVQGLEGWTAAKITKAADYLSSVYHWIDYELNQGQEHSVHNTGHEDIPTHPAEDNQ